MYCSWVSVFMDLELVSTGHIRGIIGGCSSSFRCEFVCIISCWGFWLITWSESVGGDVRSLGGMFMSMFFEDVVGDDGVSVLMGTFILQVWAVCPVVMHV